MHQIFFCKVEKVARYSEARKQWIKCVIWFFFSSWALEMTHLSLSLFLPLMLGVQIPMCVYSLASRDKKNCEGILFDLDDKWDAFWTAAIDAIYYGLFLIYVNGFIINGTGLFCFFIGLWMIVINTQGDFNFKKWGQNIPKYERFDYLIEVHFSVSMQMPCSWYCHELDILLFWKLGSS